MPALEAMACGTPVVASNVYALPEVCGDAAVLVDPYDVDDIAEGLLCILDDPEWAGELRRRGLARASQFTWRRSAELHVEAYERLLHRTSPIEDKLLEFGHAAADRGPARGRHTDASSTHPSH